MIVYLRECRTTSSTELLRARATASRTFMFAAGAVETYLYDLQEVDGTALALPVSPALAPLKKRSWRISTYRCNDRCTDCYKPIATLQQPSRIISFQAEGGNALEVSRTSFAQTSLF